MSSHRHTHTHTHTEALYGKGSLNINTQRVEHGKPLIPSLFPQDMHIDENAIINNLMKTKNYFL